MPGIIKEDARKLNIFGTNQVGKGKVATRDGYGKGLVAAGKKNKAVVALDADLSDST